MNQEIRPDGSDGLPSLLIADDDAFMRSTLSAQLEGGFHVVAAAGTTAEAVELAAEHLPDVALIDVQMPGGGAREVVPKVAARSPGTCMVILSGDESRSVVLELLDAGAVAYVRKGVSGGQLIQTLTDSLAAKATERRT